MPHRITAVHSAGIFIAAATLSFVAAPASAITAGYEVTINDPVFNSANGIENVPDFQITNTSDVGSGLTITDFSLTIGDTDFIYDFVRNEGTLVDTVTTLVATLDNPDFNNDEIGTGILTYSFGGFDPNDVFQFEVDVDPVVLGDVVQDFRQILFPNAVLTVTFNDNITLSQILAPIDITQVGFTFSQSVVIPLPGGLALLLGAGAVSALVLRRRRPR
ncbi:MAG: hypothetical protein AAF968_07885 [Pseudomonadota bacterium]